MSVGMARKSIRIARRTALAGALAVALGGMASFEALFAPSSELWPVWQAHDEDSTMRVDHTEWDRLLSSRVTRGPDGVARFAYKAVTADERRALDLYIARLSATRVSALARPEQFAYWVNLYNALTVRLILDHPGVTSIRDIDISPGLFADGPWGAALATIEGRAVTLNDIEHRILRPIFRDPRIHYAVNCAAIGCPDLATRAFTAQAREAMLEQAARAYVNHPRGARVTKGRLVVSSIYIWFGEDFGGEAGVLKHLRHYAGNGLRQRLDGVRGIAGYDYDWSLNGAVN